MQNALIIAAVGLVGALLIWPRLANAQLWRATITPLASIVGSGFLVLGPILDVSYGGYAPVAMVMLCLIAYGLGGGIRFNIVQIDQQDKPIRVIAVLEKTSSATLAFAFVISVAYYLNLFGAFAVSLTDVDNQFHARLITTMALLLILAIGWTRGFLALERFEQITVGVKLSIIAGLIMALVLHFGESLNNNTLKFETGTVSGWQAITLLAGLIVTVQGFETSRYLGETYSPSIRVTSMRLAQWISSLIYVVYVTLLAYAFDNTAFELTETAIIDIMKVVSPILPALLVAAALSAQLSAAIADTSGSGGLVAEISHGVISEKMAYAILVGLCLVLTWTTNIFEIISYASRAFAAYYAIQSAIATGYAYRIGSGTKTILFAGLTLLAIFMAAFGQAVE